MTYARFMDGVHKAGIELDRKVLADLAVHEPEAFNAIVDQAKAADREVTRLPATRLPRPAGSKQPVARHGLFLFVFEREPVMTAIDVEAIEIGTCWPRFRPPPTWRRWTRRASPRWARRAGSPPP